MGPCEGVAVSVTAWLTAHPLGFESLGVAREIDGWMLSTLIVSEGLLVSPAAFVALSVSWKEPEVPG